MDASAGEGRVRFRIDGFFVDQDLNKETTFKRLIGRVRVLAHLPSYDSYRPQEGRIDSVEGNIPCDVRVSIVPAVGGEKVVLRLLYLNEGVRALEDLTLSNESLELLKSVGGWRSGLILICGPSGSGKTTTLYALVHHLMAAHADD